MTPSNQHPWFAPLYRRIAVVTVCVLWLALEVYGGETIWGFVAAAVTAYAVWSLLIAYRPPPPD